MTPDCNTTDPKNPGPVAPTLCRAFQPGFDEDSQQVEKSERASLHLMPLSKACIAAFKPEKREEMLPSDT